MLLRVDPLEGVLDATLFVCGLKLLAAHQYPLAGLAFAADVMHAVVVEDELPGNYLKVHAYFRLLRMFLK